MNLSEFKSLFASRRLCLTGNVKEAYWATQKLERIGFNHVDERNMRWRGDVPFCGEIWATNSGLNWTFFKHRDERPDAIRMPIPVFADTLYGRAAPEEDIACPSLEDVL